MMMKKTNQTEIKAIKMKDGKTLYFQETDNGFIEVDKPKIKNNRYIPQYNDSYFYVSMDGEVWRNVNRNTNQDITHCIYTNNCFETVEEGKRKREIFDFIYSKRCLFTMSEWADSNIAKWYISANMVDKTVKPYSRLVTASSDFYWFKNEDVTQEVIDFVGFDDWCKYVLNIYED